MFLVYQTVRGRYQPVGGNDGGSALDSGGRLEVEDCHERRPQISLRDNPPYDSVLTFPFRARPHVEVVEKERQEYCSSHLTALTLQLQC